MARSQPPGWYRLTPFLGRAPDLTARQWRVLGLVAAVSFFEQYDMYLFALNLVQIQAELGIAEAHLGWLGSVVRAGALMSIFIALAADRFGRRRMLLFTVIGYTLMTGATALAPDATSFVVFQCLARALAGAEALLAAVVIIEEFDARNRGWGIGAAAAIQACGAGFAALMFGFVDVLPWGWRSLYLVGLVPLLLVAHWRRTLPETERFQRLEAAAPVHAAVGPLTLLGQVLALPRIFVVLAAAVFCVAMAGGAAAFFAPKYLQDVHHWAPSQVAMLTLFGGAFAIVGNPLSGWLSDRIGRRPTSMAFACLFGFTVIALYSVTGVFPALLWVAMIFTLMGTDVTLTTYGGELFDTAKRSTAAGARGFFGTLGGIAGLAAVSVLHGWFGSIWMAISVLAGGVFLVPLIVWLTFPETAGRELEEIAGGDPAP